MFPSNSRGSAHIFTWPRSLKHHLRASSVRETELRMRLCFPRPLTKAGNSKQKLEIQTKAGNPNKSWKFETQHLSWNVMLICGEHNVIWSHLVTLVTVAPWGSTLDCWRTRSDVINKKNTCWEIWLVTFLFAVRLATAICATQIEWYFNDMHCSERSIKLSANTKQQRMDYRCR